MRALITGVAGQDGHYLSEYLKKLGYTVYGGYRRSSNMDLPDVEPVPLEMTDYESIRRAIKKVGPDEIYNLAAQSHVGESFSCPIYTSDVNYAGVLRLLELVRSTKTRLYQASTSEMFGGGIGLNEQSRFKPRSPYAVAKLAAHEMCNVYRRSYNVRVSCGILFNHESPLRGKDFVTRKVTYHVANRLPFTLANVDSVRDWGHAKDYVRAMHLMMQATPDDFVIATGESHSIEQLVREAEEYVPWSADYTVVEAEKRPWDVKMLEGDFSKAREVLGWIPIYTFPALIKEMMDAEPLHATAKTDRVSQSQGK